MVGRADVFIAGAGPAGLSAAIAAASAGFSVLVADAVRPPLEKACGEGLMPDALAALAQLGVSLEDTPSYQFRGIRFICDELSSEAAFTVGYGRGIRRTSLSAALLEKAEQLGVRFLWNNPIRNLKGAQIQLKDGTVTARWIIGADGDNSTVRRLAGIQSRVVSSKRIGLRRHFHIRPWSDFVEIHWGNQSQAYVTPTTNDEICVAIVSRRRIPSFEQELLQFPALCKHLADAEPSDAVRGSATLHGRVVSVAQGNIALIGQASASVDALTGEGLALGFRQAIALADALRCNNLQHYREAHAKILRLPQFMSRTLLLLDSCGPLRRRVMRTFDSRPEIFQTMLQIHLGEQMPRLAGRYGIMHLGAKALLG